MKYFFATFALLFVAGFVSADVYQHISNNGLLRNNKQHPFDKLTSTGGAKKREGSKPPQWDKPGGLDQAFTDFTSLLGKSEKDVSTDDKIAFTKDMGEMGRVTMREYSKEGSPTLELQPPGGGPKIKAIRYGN